MQTEAEQVNDGRETLGNTFDGLQLAIPVSQSLYFSGPAGPAISFSFQLAVVNSAVGTGIDTTNKMHEDSRKHGERLIALAQQYDEAFRLVSSADFVASIRSLSSGTGSLASASTVSTFGNLNASATPKESGRPAQPTGREQHPAPGDALSGFADRVNLGGWSTTPQQAAQNPNAVNHRTASAQRSAPSATRLDTQTRSGAPEQATPAIGVESEETKAAAGATETERAPVDIMTSGIADKPDRHTPICDTTKPPLEQRMGFG